MDWSKVEKRKSWGYKFRKQEDKYLLERLKEELENISEKREV